MHILPRDEGAEAEGSGGGSVGTFYCCYSYGRAARQEAPLFDLLEAEGRVGGAAIAGGVWIELPGGHRVVGIRTAGGT